MKPRPDRSVSLLLLLLVLADLCYSFWQHYHGTLDGDMPAICLPAPAYAVVLKDPLGFQALLHHTYYAAPNRFMPHWSMLSFYKHVPLFLQHFVSPLDSVYLAGAIAKTAIQAALIYLMSAYASGSTNLLNRSFLLSALLITPFFQAYGFVRQIGIIDPSVTYSFFYALSSAWLLLFFLPYMLYFLHDRPLSISHWAGLLMIPAALIVSFNGPLNSAVMLLVCPVLLILIAFRRYCRGAKTPPILLYGLIAGLVCAAWSFYVGRYNIENIEQALPLAERYTRLSKGINDYLQDGPAPLLILVACLLSIVLVNMFALPKARSITLLSLYFLALSVIFVTLLPLGGYREYRPFIIRRDSIQPLLIGGITLYALCSQYLLSCLPEKTGRAFLIIPLAFGLYFTFMDSSGSGYNYDEREALHRIAIAPGPVVEDHSDANIMAWRPTTDYKGSVYAAQLLYYWHIFPEVKYYYQKP